MIDSPFYAPRFDIRISGLTLAADISSQVISVTYENSLDIADMFSIVLRNADNQLIDSALFDLGKNVEVYMGYGNDLRPMMLGEVTAIEPSFPESGAPTLHISGYDKSYKLRQNQPDRRKFQYTTDSAIAALIAGEAGLIPVVDPSPIFHKKPLVQSGSDMALLKARARANYFDVYVHWDKLYFQFPRPQSEAYVLEWGKNLSSYSPRISSAGLAGLQVIRGYNEALAQTVVAFTMAADLNPDDIVEKMGSTALELLLSLGRRVIRHEKVETSLDARQVAISIMRELLEGMYEGSGHCIGIPDLRAGKFVNIQGIGKRFSGQYRLRKVTHTIDGNGYHTSFEVTQKNSADFLPQLRKSLQNTPPPDKEAPLQGVAIGIVTANNDTQEKDGALGRVKLSFPWFSDTFESDWVSCVTPLSGRGIGMFFLPEVGSEVLVAFVNGDISKPIVLGSLWNDKKRPPGESIEGLDKVRIIKTKSGHTIMLDDTQGSEKILITDKGNSQITMHQDGTVTISAAKDLILKAKRSITLDTNRDNGSITLGADKVDVNVKTSMNVS
jgi:phage protein D